MTMRYFVSANGDRYQRTLTVKTWMELEEELARIVVTIGPIDLLYRLG